MNTGIHRFGRPVCCTSEIDWCRSSTPKMARRAVASRRCSHEAGATLLEQKSDAKPRSSHRDSRRASVGRSAPACGGAGGSRRSDPRRRSPCVCKAFRIGLRPLGERLGCRRSFEPESGEHDGSARIHPRPGRRSGGPQQHLFDRRLGREAPVPRLPDRGARGALFVRRGRLFARFWTLADRGPARRVSQSDDRRARPQVPHHRPT